MKHLKLLGILGVIFLISCNHRSQDSISRDDKLIDSLYQTQKLTQPEILYYQYLSPDEVVKIALDGIDTDLNILDYLLLVVCIFCFAVLLNYFVYLMYAITNKGSNNFKINAEDSTVEIFGFKIDKKHGITFIMVATFIHFLVGLAISSKTDLIVEYAKHCEAYSYLSPQKDSNNNVCIEIKKLIAAKYAYQSLEGSRLYQFFNYHKMFLSNDVFHPSKLSTFLILSLPFILFSVCTYIIFFTWSKTFSNNFLYWTIIKWISFIAFYAINLYSIYNWVGGVMKVSKIVHFGFKLSF